MRYVLRSEDRAEILATVVPQGLEPIALTKGQAEAVLTTGAEALMGHGIEVAFDFGEQPTWYHGEICGVTADKIRVRTTTTTHAIGTAGLSWSTMAWRCRQCWYRLLLAPPPWRA